MARPRCGSRSAVRITNEDAGKGPRSASATSPAAGRGSRKPDLGDPECNLLAEAADATAIDDRFDVGLAALLQGFGVAP